MIDPAQASSVVQEVAVALSKESTAAAAQRAAPARVAAPAGEALAAEALEVVVEGEVGEAEDGAGKQESDECRVTSDKGNFPPRHSTPDTRNSI